MDTLRRAPAGARALAALTLVGLLGCADPGAATSIAPPSASSSPTATAAATATPWPLLGTPPTPCPVYTSPGPVVAWPTVDPGHLATLADADLCLVRVPKRPGALRPSGGPYVGQDEIERRVAGSVAPSKMRSYLVTYAAASRLLGGDSDGPDVYPDREVWLVVVAQGPHQCARPSLKPGVPEWPRRWCFGVYEATTGQAYYGGGNGPTQGDWPPYLPRD
jgi:hypothetical protein